MDRKREDAQIATPINAEMVKFYYDQINKIADDKEISLTLDWNTLLRMPDVMAKQDVEELTDEGWSAAECHRTCNTGI